jgi:hypothetical protein
MTPVEATDGSGAPPVGTSESESELLDKKRRQEEAIRQDERSRIIDMLRNRKQEAIEEARRAWTALARREGVLRSAVATHNRMLGRTDILYDPWRLGRESTPAFSQAELRDIRTNVQGMIYQQDNECDVLMSWARFNDVIQCYDYVITQDL